MKRTLALFAALLLTVTGCGNATTAEETAGNSADTDAAVTETQPEYTMPDMDLAGKTFRMLNFESLWNMSIHLDHAEQTGDLLNDAVYSRNRKMEELFNFTFEETEAAYTGWDTGFIDLSNMLIDAVIAGDATYDGAYLSISQRMDLITQGYITNLADISTLQLDRPWWDTFLNDNIRINDKLFMASGSLNLMPYDAMTSIFFNKQIHENYGMPNLYDMVREGTWTIDELLSLCEQAANLNGEQKWTYVEGGTPIYGIAKHRDFPAHFLYGCGITYVNDDNGQYAFQIESDDFYTAVEKITTLFDPTSGVAVGGAHNFEPIFGAGRSLFLMDELKGCVALRDSDVNFGLLPAPKLREEQADYVTDVTERLMFLCVPITNTDLENTGALLDAMSYDSFKNVVPIYYDNYISHKGLRDEDSLEMLEIMTRTRCMDVGMAYGWCGKFITNMNYAIDGTKTITSMVASNKESINTAITDFINQYMK